MNDETEAPAEPEEDQRVVKSAVTLTDGSKISITVPHPFTSDAFESAIVVLLNMRVASEQRTEAEAPVIVPKGPVLVTADGRPLAAGRRAD